MKAAITTKFHNAIIGFRVTEKAANLTEKGVYTFDISPETTKATLALVIKKLYKVTPVRIAFVKRPSKEVFSRGKRGTKKGGVKAYVTLKKGEKIEAA